MPRQPKWIAAGTYQPTYEPRRAYGPRRWGRRDLVEEVLPQGYVLDAKAMARYGHTIEARLVSADAKWWRALALGLPVLPDASDTTLRPTSSLAASQYRLPRLPGATVSVPICWQADRGAPGRTSNRHARQIEQTPRDSRGYLPVPARRQKERARHILRMSRYERAQDIFDQ